MATSTGYISLLEFKNYKGGTGIFGSDTTDDTIIGDLIQGASRFIDAMTGRFFYASSTGTVRYYKAVDAGMCFVDDLVSLESLKTDDDGDGTFDETWNTGQNTGDFWLMPLNASENGKPYSWIEVNPDGDYSFPVAPRAVKVTGKFGWSTPPLDVKLATYEIVNSAYGRKTGQNLTGVPTITAAGIVVTPSDITPFAQRVIDSYRRSYGWE